MEEQFSVQCRRVCEIIDSKCQTHSKNNCFISCVCSSTLGGISGIRLAKCILVIRDFHCADSRICNPWSTGQSDDRKLKKVLRKSVKVSWITKIDLEDIHGEQRKIAEQVNSIGSGLDAAVEKNMKSERLKTDLITNVSHDIKTPLTSIINYVNLLKQEKFDDPKIQRYIEVLEEKSQRLKTLTEDVVEASKVSSGNISLEFMNINMIELIQQTSGEFEEKFQARNLTQIMNLPEEDAIVRVDGRRMWRVLANIYNNAAKYAMEGTRIYADLQTLDGKVIFSLKNISEQPLNISSAEELTERFIRGDLSRSTEGSGLGLSIAKTLTNNDGRNI